MYLKIKIDCKQGMIKWLLYNYALLRTTKLKSFINDNKNKINRNLNATLQVNYVCFFQNLFCNFF